MPIPFTTKHRKKTLFPCLALCAGLGLLIIPARCQPPAPTTEYYVPQVEQQWQDLRTQMAEEEIRDPQNAINQYQKFYEDQGVRSGVTSVEITNTIAQLYWQSLDNPQKALTIYDWGLKQFSQYPGIKLLQEGRDVVAQMGHFSNTYSVEPVTVAKSADASSSKSVQIVTLQPPSSKTLPTILPIDTVSPATPGKVLSLVPAPVNNPFAPSKVTQPAPVQGGAISPLIPASSMTGATKPDAVSVTSPVSESTSKTLSPVSLDKQTVMPAASTVIPANPRVGEAGIHAGSKSTFDAVTVAQSDSQTVTKVLSPIIPTSSTSDTTKPDTVSLTSPISASSPKTLSSISLADRAISNTSANALSPITPPAPSATPLSGALGIDPHLLQLSNIAEGLRAGRLKLDDVLAAKTITPQDALQMLKTPGIIIGFYTDAPLRAALVQLLQANPSLVEPLDAQPPAVQFAFAQADAKAQNPAAEKLFLEVVQQKLPANAWWTRELAQNDLAEFYAAEGKFDKAAETKLQIAAETTYETWQGNSYVEAARYYIQAGEPEKATPLYQKAEKSSYGWAAGVALVDEGKALISQGKYGDAIRVLSQSVTGRFADQIQVVLLSLIARSYYLSSDLTNAVTYSDKAISQYNELKNPLQNEGLQELLSSAKDTLRMAKIWQQKPFIAEPDVVNFNKNKDGFVIVKIRQYNAVPITVTTTSSSITAKLVYVPWPEENEGKMDVIKEVYCKLQGYSATNSSEDAVIVRSSKYPNYELRIPVEFNVKGK